MLEDCCCAFLSDFRCQILASLNMASGHVVVIRLMHTCIIRVEGIFGCERFGAPGMVDPAQVVIYLLCEEVGCTERISLQHMA